MGPVERSRHDPAFWCQHILGTRLWAKQQAIVRDTHRHRKTVVRSCHAAGKTFLAANAAMSFLSVWPKSIVITTATTQRQVKGLLWKEIHRLHAASRLPLGGDLTTTAWHMAKDWFCLGFTSKENDATKFQGFHAEKILVIVDEAAGVGQAVFEGLDSVLSSGDGHMLAIGNPTTERGEFGAMFRRPAVARHTISAFDTPNFTTNGITFDDIKSGAWEAKARRTEYPTLCTPQWVAEKFNNWGEDDPRFVSRVLGLFPAQDETSLHPEVWIDHAFDEWRDREELTGWSGDAQLGCDVARLGGDTSQIARYRIGQGIERITELPAMDTMSTARAIVHEVESLQDKMRVASVRIDMDGLGSGIYDSVRDRMRSSSVAVIGVANGRSAIAKERYTNARSELHFALREAIEPDKGGMALPPDDDLKSELLAHAWKIDRTGRVAVASKDEIKQSLGRSPDKADACAYAIGDVAGEVDLPIYTMG